MTTELNCVTHAAGVLDDLVRQRNVLIAKIESLNEEHELAVNAMNVTHEVSLQSHNDRLENDLALQLRAGLLHYIVVEMKVQYSQ